MRRFIIVFITIYIIFWLIIASLAGYVLSVESVRDNYLGRLIDERLFFGEGRATVVLEHEARPDVVCPTTQQATAIFLLIDNSDSMDESNAFEPAQQAAIQFVENVDLNLTQVGIIFFNRESLLSQALTHDKIAITTSITNTTTPSGSTDIIKAMQLAQSEFETSNLEDTVLPVIILLSDGTHAPNGTVEENTRDELERQLIAASNTIKNTGVRIITIGLGDAVNRTGLKAVASNDNDSYIAPTPQQLADIYIEIAEGINRGIANDVFVTEIPNERLQVVPDSLQPTDGIIAADGSLQWQLPQLQKEGARFSYDIIINKMGFYPANEKETEMSYQDCLAGPLVLALASGPSLLVLPSPLFAFFLALLPLLIPLFVAMAFWRRKKDEEPAPKRPKRDLPEDVELDPIPAWLRALTKQEKLVATVSPTHVSDQQLNPTVIIGVGPVGRIVLNQIAETLRGRYGGEIPDEIRLLQIDVQLKNSPLPRLQKPFYLRDGEYRLLEPNVEEVNNLMERNANKYPHWRWYNPFQDSGRMHGRMAIFYDLQGGTDQSRLWTSLSYAVHKLEHPQLRVVGSTFDDTSGMLVDVARLVQLIVGANIDVEMWLSGPVKKSWGAQLKNNKDISPNEQIVRNLATLRELERFQCNLPAPFYYVAPDHIQQQLRGTSNAAVIQTIYLFEPKTTDTEVEDHLAVISDSLMVMMLDKVSSRIKQEMNASISHAGKLINEQNMGVIGLLGAYTVRTPILLIEKALIWHLMYDILFENAIGIYPFKQWKDNGQYQDINRYKLNIDENELFEDAVKFVSHYRNRYQLPIFKKATSDRLNRFLNGEGDHPAQTSRAGLVRALSWLGEVIHEIEIKQVPEVEDMLKGVQAQLENWEAFLKDLAEEVEANWQKTRQELESLTQQGGRYWAMDDELDWGLYQQYIRKSDLQIDVLEQGRSRFGWWVDFEHRDWRINWVVPNHSFSWSEEDPNLWRRYVMTYKERDKIADQLFQLLSPLVQAKRQVEYVIDYAENLNADQWVENALPNLPVSKVILNDYMKGNVQTAGFLITPALGGREDKVATTVRKAQAMPQNFVHETIDDNSVVTLLILGGRAPLVAYEGYNKERWQEEYVGPEYYVWYGEQQSSSGKYGHPSASFTGIVEMHQELLDLFCAGYIVGLFSMSQDGKQATMPGLGSWLATSSHEALRNLFGSDMNRRPTPLNSDNPRTRERALKELKEAITTAKENIGKKPGFDKYKEQVQNALKPLIEKKTGFECDFYAYVLHLADKELKEAR